MYKEYLNADVYRGGKTYRLYLSPVEIISKSTILKGLFSKNISYFIQNILNPTCH